MKTIIKQSYHFKDFTTEFEQCDFSEKPEFTVLYIHGLKSNPWARKADNIKELCRKNGLNFRRYELLGHGSDEKKFLRCDFELWKDQLRDIIANHITGPVIIVGHCVGGWLGMSIAEEYPDRIKAFLGLAAAPDLIEQLLERSTLEQRQTLADTGFVEAQVEKYHYVFFTKAVDQSSCQRPPAKGQNRHHLPGSSDTRTTGQFRQLAGHFEIGRKNCLRQNGG